MIRALFVVLAVVATVQAVRRRRRPGTSSAAFLAVLFTMMAVWGPAVGAYS